MALVALSELLIVFALGLFGLLPAGVPPLPEDPVLLRMAPADSVAYLAWFGRDERAGAANGNRTEALWAEPEVQAFGERFAAAVRNALRSPAMPQEGAALAAELFDLGVDALARPGCLWLALPQGGPAPRVGLALSIGDAGDRWDRRLRLLESRIARALQGLGADTEVAANPPPVDGIAFRALPLPADGPVVSWAVADGYLMLALGAEAPAAMVRGLRGDDGLAGTPLVQALRARAAVARPAFRAFLNAGPLLQLARQAGHPDVAAALAVLGLDQVEGFWSESGLQGDGYATSARLALQARKGLFDLFGSQPLGVDDLALVPGDATVALALSLDPERVLALALELAELDHPGAKEEFDDEIVAAMQEMFGIDLRRDLLAGLGDKLVVWNAPSQGGLLFTGLCAAVPIADPQAFGQAFGAMMQRLEQLAPRRQPDQRGRVRREYYLEKAECRGRPYWFINPVGDDDLPFAPSWTLTDTHLLFSLYPQALRETLARGADLDTSLTRQPAVAGHAGAVAIEYVDAGGLLERLYPVLPMLFTLGAVEWQRDGFDLHAADLPRLSALLPHLGPETSVLTADPRGLQLERRGTLPMVDPVLLGGLPLAAMPLFLYRARAAQVRAVEIRRQALEAERRAREEAEKRRRGKDGR